MSSVAVVLTCARFSDGASSSSCCRAFSFSERTASWVTARSAGVGWMSELAAALATTSSSFGFRLKSLDIVYEMEWSGTPGQVWWVLILCLFDKKWLVTV